MALRIGVNHGSLAKRVFDIWGDTPEGMVESAMEFLKMCREADFHEVVVSMKSMEQEKAFARKLVCHKLVCLNIV